MLLNSLEFLCFFPIVCLVYFLISHKYRWVWLLVSSYVFYMGWNATYALLLLFSTTVTWLTGLAVDRCIVAKRRKVFLGLGIAINLSILFVLNTSVSLWKLCIRCGMHLGLSTLKFSCHSFLLLVFLSTLSRRLATVLTYIESKLLFNPILVNTRYLFLSFRN